MKLRDLARAERLTVLLEEERHSTIAIGENSPGADLVQEPIEKSLDVSRALEPFELPTGNPPGVSRALEPFELPTEKFPGVVRALEPFEKSPDVAIPDPAIEFASLESALA